MLTPTQPNSQPSRWPFRLAVALVCVTFPLIWIGGLVTTYDAGMAVPDWPGTYGYNLFLYPPSTWIFGPFDLLIEHGHRLLGALAGFVTIGLVAVTFRFDPRPAARYAAVGAFVLVCAQGALGGLRVLLDERSLAMVHGCVGPAFLAYAVALAVYLSPWWMDQEVVATREPGQPITRRCLRLTVLTTVFAYLQLILGAQVRHMPAEATPNTFRLVVLFHVFLALVVVGHGLALAGAARSKQVPRAVRLPAMWLALALVGQFVLGGGVWIVKYGWPFGLSDRLSFAGTTVVANSLPQALTVTTHVALGSLILALGMLAAVRAMRLTRVVGCWSAFSCAMLWEVSR